MKKTLLTLLALPSLLFCELEQEAIVSEPLEESLLSNIDFIKKKPYFSIGTSVFYQKAGVGVRWHNFSTEKGHDLSLNAVVIPSGFIKDFSSSTASMLMLDYSYLKYKPIVGSSDYSYFGMGFGLGEVVKGKRIRHTVLLFNPRLLWGTEYESGRFSQLAVNIVPLAVTAVAVPVLTEYSIRHPEENFPFKHVARLLGLSFEYSFGF